MAFQPAPNCASCRIQATSLGVQVENVLHFAKADGNAFDSTDLEDLSAAVTTAWGNNIIPILGANYVWRQVVSTYLGAETGPQHTGVLSPPLEGLAAGEQVANMVAVCVTLNTQMIGRSFRGRMYLVGVTEGQMLGNSLTATAFDAYQAAVSDFYDDLKAYPFLWSVLSRWSAGVKRADAIYTPITSVGLRDAILDTQRRRMR